MDIIITDADEAAAIFGELHSYHRHCERAVSLPQPSAAVAAWALARDVPTSGAPASPAPRGIGGAL